MASPTAASRKDKADVENISGKSFMETAWVPPNVQLAALFVRKSKIDDGEAAVVGTPVERFASTSHGLYMYMALVKRLACFFLLTSLLVTPTIVIAMAGTLSSEDSKDPIGIIKYTIGNIGKAEQPALNTTTTVESLMILDRAKLSFEDAAIAISVVDLLWSVLFLLLIGSLRMTYKDTASGRFKAFPTPQDYSMYVTGLPADCTRSEIRDHFSELYDLSKEDWSGYTCCWGRKRKRGVPGIHQEVAWTSAIANREEIAAGLSPTQGRKFISGGVYDPAFGTVEAEQRLKPSFRHNSPSSNRVAPTDNFDRDTELAPALSPVTDTKFSEFNDDLGSWVADVNIVHPVGKYIQRFLNARARVQRLAAMKGQAKMKATVAPNTTKTLDKLLQRIEKLESKFETQRQSLRKSGKQGFDELQSKTHAAFVVFNHRESARRCEEDYEGSTSICSTHYCCQPKALRLQHNNKRHRISVQRANDPSDIKWQNLDVGGTTRCIRSSIVVIITLILITSSLAFLYQGQQAKQEYSKNAPRLSDCGLNIPATLYGNTSIPGETALKRDLANTKQFCDLGTFYLYYETSNGIVFPTTQDLKPNSAVSSCGSPCVSPSATELCDTLDPKIQYVASAVAGCYCKDRLLSLIATQGPIEAAQTILDEDQDVCLDFLSSFLASQLLVLGAAGGVVVVNAVLQAVLAALAKFELHGSETTEVISTAAKIFAAQFFNMGVLIVAVNSRLPQVEPPLQGTGFLEGDYTSPQEKWYSVVAVSIVLSMLLNAVVPHASTFVDVVKHHGVPCLTCFARRLRVRAGDGSATQYVKKVHKHGATQAELNQRFVPPSFRIIKRFAHIMTTLFVATVYAGPIPVVVPVAAFTFILSYWIDKWVLLRVYRRPPQYDETMALWAIKVMPIALCLHLGMSIWAYGQHPRLQSKVFGADVLGDTAQQWYIEFKEKAEDFDSIGLLPTILQTHVLPLAVCLFAIVFWKTLGGMGARAFVRVVSKCFYYACCCCLCRRNKLDDSDDAEVLLGYTDDFEVPLDPSLRHHLTPKELKAGWKLVLRGVPAVPVKVKTMPDRDREVRSSTSSPGGSQLQIDTRDANRILKTWEVVAEMGLHSYDITENPVYASVVKAFTSAASTAGESAFAYDEFAYYADQHRYDEYAQYDTDHGEYGYEQGYNQRHEHGDEQGYQQGYGNVVTLDSAPQTHASQYGSSTTYAEASTEPESWEGDGSGYGTGGAQAELDNEQNQLDDEIMQSLAMADSSAPPCVPDYNENQAV